MTVDKKVQRIFRWNDGKPRTTVVDLHDLGEDEDAKHMQKMYTKNKDGTKDPYDFTDMEICNSYIAINSFWFAVGLVGEFDITQKLGEKRRNDKRSLVGIFKFDPKTKSAKIEYWINEVSV